jgi:hypothetical protein
MEKVSTYFSYRQIMKTQHSSNYYTAAEICQLFKVAYAFTATDLRFLIVGLLEPQSTSISLEKSDDAWDGEFFMKSSYRKLRPR